MFKDLAPRDERTQEAPPVPPTRHRFGDVKPVTSAPSNRREIMPYLFLALAVATLIVGLSLLSLAFREDLPLLKPIGDLIAPLIL